jgi:NAD(P)-dependent dehydrogenase (short-subunit alcohol dehydrogenase family)
MLGATLGNKLHMLRGKTFLVTGSTDGIGQYTALLLAKSGANVLLHGRNWDRLQKTKHFINEQLDPELRVKEIIKCYCSDLQSLAGAKNLANEIIASNERLDGLINNAGVFQESLIITEDGLESTFAVNVCAPFILICLLLPLLRRTKHSKILNVSSISQSGSLQLDNLEYQHGGFSSYSSYGFSKLCIAAMSHELAKRISAEEALVMSCDPGTVNTKMLLAGWGYCGIRIEVGRFEKRFCNFLCSLHLLNCYLYNITT